jgi:hypothetical protein
MTASLLSSTFRIFVKNLQKQFKAKPLIAVYFAVLFGAAVLYFVSCATGPLWQDSGLIQYRIWHSDIEGFFGLALSHPLFYILAIGVKDIPLGEFAHRVNLISSIAAAITVANLFLLVRLWLGKNLPAVFAAVTLALSHTFWRHASILETYTLWTALFTAELIVLLQYTKTRRVVFLYWLGLLNGFAIAVHMLASIALLCYVIFIAALLVKKEIRLGHLAVIIFLWIVGALPYEYLIIKNIIQSSDVAGTLASAAFGNRWQSDVLNTALSVKTIKENVLYIILNFPTPNVLFFFAGCVALFKLRPRPAFASVLLTLTLLFFIFAFRYTVVDRYAFFIPFYCMVSLFVGVGIRHLQICTGKKVLITVVALFSLLPVAVYAVAPTLAKKARLNLGTRDDVPYRNDYKYFLQPWKIADDSTRRFASEALDAVGPEAVIYADTTTVGPLLYMQEVKGRRPDIKIVSSIVSSKGALSFNTHTITHLLATRPVYIVSRKPNYCPSFVLQNYDLVQAGPLWQVLSPDD